MREQRGFTYLGLLLGIAVLGVGLTVAAEVWVTTAKRQKIEELEWRGAQIVQAIGSYYESAPGGAVMFPRSVDDLLEDRRFTPPRRHLRKAHANPLAYGAGDWELLVGADGGIRGVRAQTIAEQIDGPAKGRDFVYVPLLR